MTTLLTLPLEIRNFVYRELLVDRNHARRPQLYGEGAETALHTAILCTCRQIYDEAATILYKENIFLYRTRWFLKRLDRSMDRGRDTFKDETFKRINHVRNIPL